MPMNGDTGQPTPRTQGMRQAGGRGVVAVDNELSNVKEALQRAGYQVVDVENAPSDCLAVVVTGMDENVMNMSDRAIRAHMIDAAGKDADEIVESVRQHAEQMAGAPDFS